MLGENVTPVDFQVDTGSGVSIMNIHQFVQLCGDKPLETAHLKLTSFSGDNIKVLGKSDVQVQIGKQCKKLPLIVVEGNGTPLLGRQMILSY